MLKHIALPLRDQIKQLAARVKQLESAPPPMSWRGAWTDGTEHPTGATVTHDGSLWYAEITSRARPGSEKSG